MSFLCTLLESFQCFFLGGREHFDIELLSTSGARPRSSLIFSILHDGRCRGLRRTMFGPTEKTTLPALSNRKLKLRASAQSPPDDAAQVVIVIADGVRPDVLARSIDRGELPALARIRGEGALATITSAFPSVTGPAYAPFLMGRYPGSVGLPGLRWYDRSRKVARFSGHARSYVGAEMRFVDRDIDSACPTIFELAKPSLGALSVIARGLRRRQRIGRSPAFVARAAATHFRGNVRGWLEIDRSVGEEAARRLRTQRIQFAVVGPTGIIKTS